MFYIYSYKKVHIRRDIRLMYRISCIKCRIDRYVDFGCILNSFLILYEVGEYYNLYFWLNESGLYVLLFLNVHGIFVRDSI